MPLSLPWRRAPRGTLHVACSTDPEYLPHCATMLHSLIGHQRRPPHVHLLASPEVTPELERRMTSWVEGLGAEITAHRVDEARLAGLTHQFSLASWYRVLLPELLPALDRVLYLDCDVIVTDSLDPLLDIGISGHLLAAVTNSPFTPEWSMRHATALGLPESDAYFNSGVLLLNLEQLRREDSVRRIIDYALEHADLARAEVVDESSTRDAFTYGLNHPERLLFPDQDSLNAVLWDRRLKLHPRWNLQLLFRRFDFRTEELTAELVAEASGDPAIRHFEGPGHSKPWHPDAEPEDRELYRAHRCQTPWAQASTQPRS